ncbi:HNH endonuclease [Brevibacillus sp. NRS-1366]|uniref:HNH endonuclease n=1 Tax=Brevibacillus sp. NRS-1366 TaxID=3233899 RepID=UPI003D19C08F
MARISRVDVNQLYNDYLGQGATIRSIALKHNISSGRVYEVLKKSNDDRIIEKLEGYKKNKHSLVFDIDNERIGVVANNTKNIFVLPKYLKEVVTDVSWNEINSGYLTGRICGTKVKLHDLVVGCAIGDLEVDHKDKNKKKNMPENLRVGTKSLNRHNVEKKRKSKTGFKGVSRHLDGTYNAAINIDNKKFSLGYFKKLEDAALRYLDVKYNLFGFEYMTDEEKNTYTELLTIKYAEVGLI